MNVWERRELERFLTQYTTIKQRRERDSKTFRSFFPLFFPFCHFAFLLPSWLLGLFFFSFAWQWFNPRLRLLLPLRAFPSCLHFATIFNHNAQSRSHRIHLFRYLVFYIFVNFHVLRLFCALCLLFPRFLVLLDFVFNVWIVWSELCCAIHVAID